MPLYLYEDSRSGKVVELILPMARRDDVPSHLRRMMTCPAVAPCKGELQQRSEQRTHALQGFREVEEKVGRTEIERLTGFSAKQIRRIWEKPNPPDKKVENN